MANLDVYELVDIQEQSGQQVLNVYFYQWNNTLAVPTAQDLIDAFQSTVQTSLKQIQDSVVTHTGVRCRNLFDESDQAEEAQSTPGSWASGAGDNLPIHDAFGFKLIQNNGALRDGAKRFAGIVEAVVTGGVITDATYITGLATLAASLIDTLSFGIFEGFFPVIVGRILDGGDYRLPANLGEAVLGLVVDSEYVPTLTSQVSRKIGVGA